MLSCLGYRSEESRRGSNAAPSETARSVFSMGDQEKRTFLSLRVKTTVISSLKGLVGIMGLVPTATSTKFARRGKQGPLQSVSSNMCDKRAVSAVKPVLPVKEASASSPLAPLPAPPPAPVKIRVSKPILRTSPKGKKTAEDIFEGKINASEHSLAWYYTTLTKEERGGRVLTFFKKSSLKEFNSFLEVVKSRMFSNCSNIPYTEVLNCVTNALKSGDIEMSQDFVSKLLALHQRSDVARTELGQSVQEKKQLIRDAKTEARRSRQQLPASSYEESGESLRAHHGSASSGNYDVEHDIEDTVNRLVGFEKENLDKATQQLSSALEGNVITIQDSEEESVAQEVGTSCTLNSNVPKQLKVFAFNLLVKKIESSLVRISGQNLHPLLQQFCLYLEDKDINQALSNPRDLDGTGQSIKPFNERTFKELLSFCFDNQPSAAEISEPDTSEAVNVSLLETFLVGAFNRDDFSRDILDYTDSSYERILWYLEKGFLKDIKPISFPKHVFVLQTGFFECEKSLEAAIKAGFNPFDKCLLNKRNYSLHKLKKMYSCLENKKSELEFSDDDLKDLLGMFLVDVLKGVSDHSDDNFLSIVCYLVEQGANLALRDIEDSRGFPTTNPTFQNALMLCKSANVAKILLPKYKEQGLLSAVDFRGHNAIASHLYKGNREVAKYLLDSKCASKILEGKGRSFEFNKYSTSRFDQACKLKPVLIKHRIAKDCLALNKQKKLAEDMLGQLDPDDEQIAQVNLDDMPEEIQQRLNKLCEDPTTGVIDMSIKGQFMSRVELERIGELNIDDEIREKLNTFMILEDIYEYELEEMASPQYVVDKCGEVVDQWGNDFVDMPKDFESLDLKDQFGFVEEVLQQVEMELKEGKDKENVLIGSIKRGQLDVAKLIKVSPHFEEEVKKGVDQINVSELILRNLEFTIDQVASRYNQNIYNQNISYSDFILRDLKNANFALSLEGVHTTGVIEALDQIKMNAGNFMVHFHPRGGSPSDKFNADFVFNLICCYRKAIAHHIKALYIASCTKAKNEGAITTVFQILDLVDKIVEQFFEHAAKLGDLSKGPSIDYDVDLFKAVFKQALQFSLDQVNDVIADTAEIMVLDPVDNRVKLTLNNFADLIKPGSAVDASPLDA